MIRPLIQSSNSTKELGTHFRRNRTRTETNLSPLSEGARLRLSQSVEHLPSPPAISGPTNVVKYSPEEVLRQIAVLNSKTAENLSKQPEIKKEAKSQTKLGRKGIAEQYNKRRLLFVCARTIQVI